jgi:hypothetical protein
MPNQRIPVQIEVVILAPGRVDLEFRSVHSPLEYGDEPDEVARVTSGLPKESNGVLHSTSWRYDEGQVILTYVALPDPHAAAPRRPIPGSIVRGDDGMEPSPEVELGDVATHACRHLAFLVATDPEVAATLSRHGGILGQLRRYTPAVAGDPAPDE